jgi:hypothetical protein
MVRSRQSECARTTVADGLGKERKLTIAQKVINDAEASILTRRRVYDLDIKALGEERMERWLCTSLRGRAPHGASAVSIAQGLFDGVQGVFSQSTGFPTHHPRPTRIPFSPGLKRVCFSAEFHVALDWPSGQQRRDNWNPTNFMQPSMT